LVQAVDMLLFTMWSVSVFVALNYEPRQARKGAAVIMDTGALDSVRAL